MSPQQLESKLNDSENAIVTWLSQFSWSLGLILIIGTVCFTLAFPFWSSPQPEWSRFYLAQDRFWGVVVLFYGFFATLYFPERWRSFSYTILLGLAWLIPVYILKIFRPVVFAPIAFVLANSLWQSYGLRSRTPISKFLTASMILASFILVVWLLGVDAMLTKDYRLFRYFWSLQLELLVFFFLASLLSSEPHSLRKSLNPLQLLAPLPWPDTVKVATERTHLKRLRLAGMVQLFRTNLTFVFLMLTLKWLPEDPGVSTNLTHYLYFLVFISAALGTIGAFIKIFGYQAPEVTSFLILAKSPLEIWQRGSTFMAHFLFQLIYFPVWKQTRKGWLAGALVLLAVFFISTYFMTFFFARLFAC